MSNQEKPGVGGGAERAVGGGSPRILRRILHPSNAKFRDDSAYHQGLLVYGSGLGIGLLLASSQLAMVGNWLSATYWLFSTMFYATVTLFLWRRVLPRFSTYGWARLPLQVLAACAAFAVLSVVVVEASHSLFGMGQGSLLYPYQGNDISITIAAEAIRRGPYLSVLVPIIPTVVMCIVGFNQHWWRILVLEGREEEMRELAVAAQLAALRAQLNPHFLFNSLNSIAQLIATDPKKAEECVERLGDIYRYILRRAHVEMVPLSDELGVVDAYLEIERARFGDALSVDKKIEDGARQVMLPSLILQPLVENAVKHGISPKVGGGCVTIEARFDNGDLRLVVRDTGVGTTSDSLFDRGVGLRNVRERLIRHYGPSYEPVVESTAGGGTSVAFRVPYSEGAA